LLKRKKIHGRRCRDAKQKNATENLLDINSATFRNEFHLPPIGEIKITPGYFISKKQH